MLLAYDYDDGISHRFGGAAAPPQAVPFVAPVVAEIQGFFSHQIQISNSHTFFPWKYELF